MIATETTARRSHRPVIIIAWSTSRLSTRASHGNGKKRQSPGCDKNSGQFHIIELRPETPRVGFEPLFATHTKSSLSKGEAISVGAEYGAVSPTAQHIEVLAVLVGILTLEQKTAFLAMLSAPKSTGIAGN